jgi:hypothetical protein
VAKQIQRFAPLRGLNPTNVGEEAGLEGTFMRGGYNVEVIDGEWWVRHGCGQASENIGSIFWRWMVSSPTEDRLFLVSDRYVVQVESRIGDIGVPDNQFFFRQLSIPYFSYYTLSAIFTVGSATAAVVSIVGPGAMTKGDIFVVEGTGGVPDRLYRIVDNNPSPGYFTLDRAYEPGGATSVSGIKVCYELTVRFDGKPGVLDADLNGGCCLFEQSATHAANTLGYANDAIDPGSFIVVVSAAGYFAVPLDPPPKVPIRGTFVRQTQLPTPTDVAVINVRPCVYKDRLFLAAVDPTGVSGLRTLWHSRPFDLLQWHTGLQGLGGTPNFFTLVDPTDPISGFMLHGDTLVVHRRGSQDILQTYGAGFRVTHNDASIGFWPRSMMENVPVGTIGWTRYGPAMFNEQGMTVLFPECERMLSRFNMSNRMNPRLRGVLHDQNHRRVYFLLGWEEVGFVDTPTEYGTRRIIRHQDASVANPQVLAVPAMVPWYSRTPVFVVDYARNEAWLEDHAGLCGGGDHLGQMYLFRYDGTVLEHPTGWSGRDFDVARINAATPVDAVVETQWMQHGAPQRKELQKIYLTLRALDVGEDVDEILGGKFSPLRIEGLGAPGDTLHLLTVEVMVDNRADVRASADVSVSVADMLSRSLEGNRMLPQMLFSITPRVAGRSFKYRFKNSLSAAAAAAGHKVGSFRLVDVMIEFEVESDTRAAGLTGGSP